MSRTKKKEIKLTPQRVDELLNTLDLEPILKHRVYQVRWLYNNSNKTTKVYTELMVRAMINKLQEKIIQLENNCEFYKNSSKLYYDQLKEMKLKHLKQITNIKV